MNEKNMNKKNIKKNKTKKNNKKNKTRKNKNKNRKNKNNKTLKFLRLKKFVKKGGNDDDNLDEYEDALEGPPGNLYKNNDDDGNIDNDLIDIFDNDESFKQKINEIKEKYKINDDDASIINNFNELYDDIYNDKNNLNYETKEPDDKQLNFLINIFDSNNQNENNVINNYVNQLNELKKIKNTNNEDKSNAIFLDAFINLKILNGLKKKLKEKKQLDQIKKNKLWLKKLENDTTELQKYLNNLKNNNTISSKKIFDNSLDKTFDDGSSDTISDNSSNIISDFSNETNLNNDNYNKYLLCLKKVKEITEIF